MKEFWGKGEIMRNARRLVSSKGHRALDHAEKMVERMQETGSEEDQTFWEGIAAQVELLVYGKPPHDAFTRE